MIVGKVIQCISIFSRISLISFLTILIVSSCSAGNAISPNNIIGDKKMAVKIDQDCDFSNINLDELGKSNNCTPVIPDSDIDDGFRGIYINSPKISKFKIEAVVGAAGTVLLIPVCAVSVFDSVQLDEITEKELIVVVDVNSHKTFTGQFIESDDDAPMPVGFSASVSSDSDDLLAFEPVVTQKMSFNFNLAKYVQLPSQDATYNIYITKGAFKSNLLQIEVLGEAE